MLFRFSLYGFLKNQRYYEPFLVLAFLEKGLSFFQIGILIAFREICVNLMEIPSGALADIFGRRMSMMVSFSAYLISFLIFGAAQAYALFFAAMFLFAIGEAFRSGTHKAMIFSWLRKQGREEERTRIYGFTRSWSKRGSAVSVVLGAVFVFTSERYTEIFYYSMLPCILSIINMAGYPAYLEGKPKGNSATDVLNHIRESIRTTWNRRPLRRLLAESMGFEGTFIAIKDYLQPILKGLVLSLTGVLAFTQTWSDTRQTAVLVGAVYFVLYLVSASASQRAHKVVDASGGASRAARNLWAFMAGLSLIILVGGWWHLIWMLVPAFIVLHIIQNFWRPILIGRIDAYGDEDSGATVMSLESQCRRLSAVILAPILGWLVDNASGWQGGGMYWPLGAAGLIIACWFLLRKEPEPD